jgi:hypothetical protein
VVNYLSIFEFLIKKREFLGNVGVERTPLKPNIKKA